jgi:hypothetical protein
LKRIQVFKELVGNVLFGDGKVRVKMLSRIAG